MNTVGKILVILNFLFAVIVGAFLVVDVAIRNQWKDSYFALKREAEALKHSNDTNMKITQKIIADYKQAKLEQEAATLALTDKKAEWEALEGSFKLEKDTFVLQLKDKDSTLMQAKATQQRLTDEITQLNTTIKNREGLIVKLEADFKVVRLQAQNFESISKTRQIQNENLLERLRELELASAREKAGIKDGPKVITVSKENPPAVEIEGKVEKVEGNQVQLTLGSDHGLAKDNTLDVYRYQPKAQWLGTVRITDVRPHTSVGTLIPAGSGKLRPQVREGDLVGSKFK
jgi:myosin heavy subunit